MEITKKLNQWDFLLEDKGYVDYKRYKYLNKHWIFFCYKSLEKHGLYCYRKHKYKY
jgi:hypothetical protein